MGHKLMQKLHGHFAYYGITVLFARHFLTAGRAEGSQEAFRAGAVGLSVALVYLETIGGIDLSVKGIVPKFHS